MKIISVSGGYQTGKTTLAVKLAKVLPNAKQFAYADRLKLITARLYPNKAHEIFAANKTAETRKLLNITGNAYKQRFGDNTWANVLLLEMLSSDYDYCIVSDARFEPEIRSLRSHCAIMIHLGENYQDYDMRIINESSHLKFSEKPDLNIVLAALSKYGVVINA